MTGQSEKRLNLYFLFDFRSEKAKITYRGLWLVFGGIATALQDHLQPPRHRLLAGPLGDDLGGVRRLELEESQLPARPPSMPWGSTSIGIQPSLPGSSRPSCLICSTLQPGLSRTSVTKPLLFPPEWIRPPHHPLLISCQSAEKPPIKLTFFMQQPKTQRCRKT